LDETYEINLKRNVYYDYLQQLQGADMDNTNFPIFAHAMLWAKYGDVLKPMLYCVIFLSDKTVKAQNCHQFCYLFTK
jgi:hypothetical protein